MQGKSSWLAAPQKSSLHQTVPAPGQPEPAYTATSVSKLLPHSESVAVPVAPAVQSYHRSWPEVPHEPLCCALVVASAVLKATGPAPLIGVADEQSSFAGGPPERLSENVPAAPLAPGKLPSCRM